MPHQSMNPSSRFVHQSSKEELVIFLMTGTFCFPNCKKDGVKMQAASDLKAVMRIARFLYLSSSPRICLECLDTL